MSEENKKSQNENQPRRFNQAQYDLLKKCSDKKDITEWNEWRKENDYIDIELDGGDFSGRYLREVDFGIQPQYGQHATGVFLEKANFDRTNLEKANLSFSHVEGARFHEAHLKDANLGFANLDNAFLLGVNLEGASLRCAKLHNANVCNANLKWANLTDSELEGAKFDNADLRKCKFQISLVNGSTSFCRCVVDKETDFREVGLDSVRIDPATKQLLKYNIRRMNWEDWYKEHKILKWPVWLFWLMNDYGSSTWRIIWYFSGVAAVFAAIYYFVPGLTNLEDEGNRFLNIVRAFYFSIITMVTGFEDINPNDKSIAGHILITVQVILGYMLLGALVARLAILFTGEGPAGKFADERKKEEADNSND